MHQTVEMHKKECSELKDIVVKYVDALERAAEGVSEDNMDVNLAYSLQELAE